MDDLFILAGPTGIGKTAISIELAKKLNGEIISADSMQIYKGMDVGSAKVTNEEMKGIPHHLIDVVSPSEAFTASDFKDRATIAIDSILSRRRLPMIVGGTGLYIDSLIRNFSFTDAGKDEQYRAELEAIAKVNGNIAVHSLLKNIDPISYKNIHPNNLKRVIRALEVYRLTGSCFSSFNKDVEYLQHNYNVKYFVLTMGRDELYKRINIRVDNMIKKGLIKEVKKLKELGFTSEMQSMKGIGYKEILYYLDGKITLDGAIDMIKQGSRNYAKRQLTWFRKDKNVIWLNRDDFSNDSEIIDYILKSYGASNKGNL